MPYLKTTPPSVNPVLVIFRSVGCVNFSNFFTVLVEKSKKWVLLIPLKIRHFWSVWQKLYSASIASPVYSMPSAFSHLFPSLA